MDVEEAACLWLLHRRQERRRKRRQHWIHPVIEDSLSHGMYVTLYPKLRNHEEKFFNYFRMSMTSFDDLLELVGEDIATANTTFRDSISPEEKLIVTISCSMYHNYKKFFSTVLLAMCDTNYSFTYVDIGAYGKSSDPAVFHNSMLYKKLMENTMNLPDAKPIFSNNTTCLPHVIVGDEAFGIMKHIMRPYSGKHLTYKKKIFNYRLSRARQYIECTFGILANKWRIFHRPLNVEMLFAENIIKAYCILHNYVRERDGYKFEDTLFEAPMADLTEGNATRGSVSANQARDMYADYFVTEGRCAWQDKMI
ncbi:uncharacterized protein [Panulirus ornatus]|uniref:uncharacterized protein n=1 Tax=Panulirus ornatus TaxID=150431 RepID=UPI003A8A5D97